VFVPRVLEAATSAVAPAVAEPTNEALETLMRRNLLGGVA
jgi:hypothetical protein